MIAVRAGCAVQVRGLSHAYGPANARVRALTDISLEIEPGGYVALTGPSGAGKSTLLALIGGLERPQQGSLFVGGRDLSRLSGDGLAEFRRSMVGFVFQHFGLLDLLSAQENIEVALSLAGVDREERRKRATTLLEAVMLADRRNHRPSALSGGERQRVAIARALANDPRLLLADEPTGNLDTTIAMRVLDVLERLQQQRGCTLLVVTHNPLVAERAGRRIAIDSGHLVSA